MGEFVEVASISDLPDNQGKLFDVKGKQVALFRKGSEVFAIDNVCVHAGGFLAEGEFDGNLVTCPLHGWQFSVKTGQSPTIPSAKVDSYKVKVENGKVLVAVD